METKITQTNTNSPLDWIDNLRVLATISVIFLHVSASITAKFGTISFISWTIGNVYNSSVRFCVPIFVMITGALLLPRDYEISDFLKKKVGRIVLPFVFWGSIYVAFLVFVKVSKGFKFTFLKTIQYLYEVIQNGIYLHFWYVYMIIGLYLFIPILGRWARNSTEKEILYFLILWSCIVCFNYPIFSKYKIDFNLSYFSGFMGYLVLGYYLSLKSDFGKVNANTVAIIMIGLGISSTIVGTSFASIKAGTFDKTFYEYLTPNVLLLSSGVFVFFKNQRGKYDSFKKLRMNISKYSYGIYFVHILVLMVLNKIGINGALINPIIGVPFTTLVCLMMSLGIIYSLNKIHFTRNLAG
ncbi:acyltransferase family protein [Flavobacterium sp.]|uniref:acyltransferase n=1 Tax=Flavobacterium sp. TaxID=239 RepID=UPI00286E3DE0|nr:acyltransferase family protein [Flavobacterium sp.]